ncbi:hypothetical protein GGR56DRAFT_674417 [Xylariaceae sp. FL0804]|nr:hypothetical protein GGR56DRAFT_674417 [Xylariaceae sp. FL0804]
MATTPGSSMSTSSGSSPIPPPAPSATTTWSNSSVSSISYYTTSTVMTTTVYTVTSCAPFVTDCPARGSVTTETIALYTTLCPVTETGAEPGPMTDAPSMTIGTVYYSTSVGTILACPPSVTDCPVGGFVTTETVVAVGTVVYPLTSAEISRTETTALPAYPTAPQHSVLENKGPPAAGTETEIETEMLALATSHPILTGQAVSSNVDEDDETAPAVDAGHVLSTASAAAILYPTQVYNTTLSTLRGTGRPLKPTVAWGGGGSSSSGGASISTGTCPGGGPCSIVTAAAAGRAVGGVGALLLAAVLAF